MSRRIAVLVTDQFEDTSPAEAEKEVTGRHGEKVRSIKRSQTQMNSQMTARMDLLKHPQRFNQYRHKFYKGEEAVSHHSLTTEMNRESLDLLK